MYVMLRFGRFLGGGKRDRLVSHLDKLTLSSACQFRMFLIFLRNALIFLLSLFLRGGAAIFCLNI